MNDFSSLEKTIVRELSCRLCLCTDVVKLKPLSAETKRKIKRLFDIVIHTDDNLPKAICHDCLQHIGALHRYTVKVDKTQKFLEFYKAKTNEDKRNYLSGQNKVRSEAEPTTVLQVPTITETNKKNSEPLKPNELQQGDTKSTKPKKKSVLDMKFLEAMPLEEFAKTESVDKCLLKGSISSANKPSGNTAKSDIKKAMTNSNSITSNDDTLDSIVLIDGRPAKQGGALDKQISLFYKMECCICHETGFNFRSLMKHYKDRHGVPGYVTCCEKKFHYFYPKKIIEHMAYHLQPNIFMCNSCHQNFQTSQELVEHQSNGGRSEGKIICPRCSERYPTYHELGWHIVTHRTEKLQCDYCGKLLKHHHRKKNINHMEDVILCSQCIRNLKNIEKQERELKEKIKPKNKEAIQKYQKFHQALGLSADEDASTE